MLSRPWARWCAIASSIDGRGKPYPRQVNSPVERSFPLLSPTRAAVNVRRPFLASAAHPAAALAVLAAGLVLRSLMLDRPGLHPDEALYASWALRIAGGSDPMLLGVYVDKPPLLLYLLGGLFRLAGFDGTAPPDPQRLVEAGRLAALLASGASLVLLWLVARSIFDARVALAALALVALSPLAVRLSPTLFTDPWLVLWLMLGLWAAQGRRAGLAGVACGLAYATKQQGVLLAPLVLAVLWISVAPDVAPATRSLAAGVARARADHRRWRALWRWLNGLALIAVFVLWWDSLRWQWMPSYWDRSAQTYGGLALADAAALPPRLAQWIELLGYGLGWPLWLAVLGLIAWAGTGAAVRRRATTRASRHGGSARTVLTGALARPNTFARVLLVYVAGYLALHLGTNLAPWDRYLLPLIPLLALLIAPGVVWALGAAGDLTLRAGRSGRRQAAVAILAAGLLYSAYAAGFARLPLGDGGAYDHAPLLAAHVRRAEPPGAVLYHHWLGWHYSFYLYGAPVELRWWQDPADLAGKATAGAGQRQLIAFPAGRDAGPVQAALAAAGLGLTPVLTATDARGAPSATLYSIERAGGGAYSDGR